MYYNNFDASFNELVGKTITNIENKGDELVFTCDDGTVYRQYHSQDCCESVTIDDICGDLEDLLDSPVLVATEESNSDLSESQQAEIDAGGWAPESFKWTFYKIDTAKGGVTIRWYGSSNGYYSESVSFTRDPQ